MKKIAITDKASVTPIRLRPGDILVIQFAKGTMGEVQEATYLGFVGAMRRSGHYNEVVAVTSGINIKSMSRKQAIARPIRRKIAT